MVFINCTADTFTPTNSGAIGTWIWEVCHAARREGTHPIVISRDRTDTKSYDWEKTILIPYPNVPAIRGMGRLLHLQKRILGWCHVRQDVYVRRVADEIRRAGLANQPIILQNDIEMAVYLRRKFPNAFIVHHAHNNNQTSRQFRKAFARSVNLALAVTDFCADWNSRYFGLKVLTLMNGVDTVRFSPEAKPPAGPVVINFVGRTDFPKGPDLLLAAAKQVASKTRNFSIQILGSNYYDRFEPDSFQQELVGLTRDLQALGIEVRRPGWITRADLPGELRKAHIHCVPARWDEPFGLTTLEGMACGLATVASRTGGTEQVSGGAAQLFERGDVNKLASLLLKLIESPDERALWSKRARARACQLTWDSTWQEMKRLITHAGSAN